MKVLKLGAAAVVMGLGLSACVTDGYSTGYTSMSVGVTSSDYGYYDRPYRGPYRPYRGPRGDRDGDGIPNRYDAAPRNPYYY
jgi:hypothetical protein